MTSENQLKSYVDAEIASIHSRMKQLGVTVDSVDRAIKAKDAHLVSNAYHMSSVENNTQTNLQEVKSRLNNIEVQQNQLQRDLSSINSMVTLLRQDQQRLLSTQQEQNRNQEDKLRQIVADFEKNIATKTNSSTSSYEECSSKVTNIEYALNAKFDAFMLKINGQVANLEKSLIEERRLTDVNIAQGFIA